MGKQLMVTPPASAFPGHEDFPHGDSVDEGGPTSFHFHHDATNAHRDHKHQVKAGESFRCDDCGKDIKEAQKANADNYVGWKVSKA